MRGGLAKPGSADAHAAMLAACRDLEQRAGPALVPNLRGRHAELVSEPLAEVAVTREAELERERGQIVTVRREPIKRRSQAERLTESVDAEPGLRPEHTCEVEGGRVQSAGELMERR